MPTRDPHKTSITLQSWLLSLAAIAATACLAALFLAWLVGP